MSQLGASIDDVKRLLGDVLQLGERVRDVGAGTRLLGNLPELDSMAVLSLIAAIEERFGIGVADSDISAETFETLGSLTEFVRHRHLAQAC